MLLVEIRDRTKGMGITVLNSTGTYANGMTNSEVTVTKH